MIVRDLQLDRIAGHIQYIVTVDNFGLIAYANTHNIPCIILEKGLYKTKLENILGTVKFGVHYKAITEMNIRRFRIGINDHTFAKIGQGDLSKLDVKFSINRHVVDHWVGADRINGLQLKTTLEDMHTIGVWEAELVHP